MPGFKQVVPWVKGRPAGYWEVVERWYRQQWEVTGWSVPYGGRGQRPVSRVRVARWEWPPVKQYPVRGWRAQIMADWLIAWQERRPRDRWFRRWTYQDLHAIRKGERPFSLKNWTAVQAQVQYCLDKKAAYWAGRHYKGETRKLVLDVRGLLTGEGGGIRPRLVPRPVKDPPKEARPPSQWDQRIRG